MWRKCQGAGLRGLTSARAPNKEDRSGRWVGSAIGACYRLVESVLSAEFSGIAPQVHSPSAVAESGCPLAAPCSTASSLSRLQKGTAFRRCFLAGSRWLCPVRCHERPGAPKRTGQPSALLIVFVLVASTVVEFVKGKEHAGQDVKLMSTDALVVADSESHVHGDSWSKRSPSNRPQ